MEPEARNSAVGWHWNNNNIILLLHFPLLVYPCGLGAIILASGSEVHGFDHGQGRWIFSDRKNPEYDFLRKGSKAMGPMS